ncbi:MAG: lactonase family protein [Verrucomicrobia bacterium]|nr:lactonase family protein [Verrucomicrobiota bacterium]
MKTVLLGAALLFAGTVSAVDTCRVYFGTVAKQDQSGIYMALLDVKTGYLAQPVQVSRSTGTGFVVLHPGGRYLYSTGADVGFDGVKTGSVKAFQILEPEGILTEINTQPSGGIGACYASIDPSGKNLLAANYTGGSCAALRIQSDGSLSPASVQQHSGSSIHKRQTQARTHSIRCDAAGRFAFAADLGMDKIMAYRFDPISGTLSPNEPPFIATEPGGGPRHFIFHPSGKFAYVSLELSSKVVAFQYDAKNGVLSEIQTLSTLPVGFVGENTTAEILTTPDGRFLYVSNRGHNSLAIFAIDAASGKLTAVGHEPTRGEVPRGFGIDPTGTFLLAANQKTGNVVVFRIHRETGALEFTGSEIAVPAPTCVSFSAAP